MTAVFRDARIAFDLDGTLVDTAPDLVRSLNAAIAPDALEPVPIEDVRAMVGRGARALIRRAYERAGREIDDPTLEARLDLFLDVYRADIAGQSRPFAGVEAALERLRSAGARLSVCTNKPAALTEPLLATLGLAGHFERIVSPEHVPAKKPDPRHLAAAFGETGSGRVMVGDSEPDVLAARAAGAPIVVFEGGYSEKPAGDLGADRLFAHFDALDEALAHALSRTS
ncbi:phosphoglycolate phosphatase [Marinicauda salina]|uniref:Phosphoglycolate phosphatase n=1 Tax=Marinicauda salina TaxID=2135793 RepID=A0A2U2BSV4_9PROT|nr:HAD-IA family hydrolase [Marinicauda salina]PWE17089.1 phosphoglycolate phosphatase [Marinicauda salina]